MKNIISNENKTLNVEEIIYKYIQIVIFSHYCLIMLHTAFVINLSRKINTCKT